MARDSGQFPGGRVGWLGFVFAFVVCTGQSAWALIEGGEGNDPIPDPGWPAGAAAVFNSPSRIAFWVGPPFGGGQYHAECRGNAAALNDALKAFARIKTLKKRIVLHDGFGQSAWLNVNDEKEKKEIARMDWMFMVWESNRLKAQGELPANVRSIKDPEAVIHAQLDIYVGGFPDWNEIEMPKKIDVVDQRLESHGFKIEDGTVLEGVARDLVTQVPIRARVALQRIEPKEGGEGYNHTTRAEVTADTDGRWVIKNAPAEWCRLVLSADGYASRVIGYARFDGQPRWSKHDSALAKLNSVDGVVVDQDGKALADVEVQIVGITVGKDISYETAERTSVKTDAEGRFAFDSLPSGAASVRVRKEGYVRSGLRKQISVPSKDMKLEMSLAAKVTIHVDFAATKRPDGYIVHIEPEGGEKVGKWSGDGQINASDEIVYSEIPPGRYVVTGRPNPGSQNQTTDPVVLDLQGGKSTQVTIKAK